MKALIATRNIKALVGILIVASGCTATKLIHFETVEIRGTSEFQVRVVSALKLLKAQAADAYSIITNEIGVIEQSKRSGMRAWLKPPKFEMADGTAYSITWCAGSIAHDSFHSKLYHDYLREKPKTKQVPEAVWTGAEAEKLCTTHQLTVLKAIGGPTNELDWCLQTNRYWDVKYHDRSW